jgi:hypothetical protein
LCGRSLIGGKIGKETSIGGYLSGLEFIQILEEDRGKLNLLLGGRFEPEEILLSLFGKLGGDEL